MSELSSTLQFDSNRWGNILAILSLDAAAPFLKDMGLNVTIDDRFRMGLRKIIEGYLRANHLDSDAESSMVPQAFDWIRKEFDESFADELYIWGVTVFESGEHGEDGASPFLWDNVFRKGGLKGERDQKPVSPFVTLMRNIMAKRQKPSVFHIKPTSSWDRDLYERRQYDEFSGAMESVQATINYYDFAKAWQEAIQISDQNDLEEANEWGIEEARTLGMPLEKLGKLGDWASLPK